MHLTLPECDLCHGSEFIDFGPSVKACLCTRVTELERALEQAIVDLNGLAHDDPFVRETAVPRARAILTRDEKAIKRLQKRQAL